MKNPKLNQRKPSEPIEHQQTAAWADIKNIVPESRVPIPSEDQVENAKEWVDTNQK